MCLFPMRTGGSGEVGSRHHNARRAPILGIAKLNNRVGGGCPRVLQYPQLTSRHSLARGLMSPAVLDRCRRRRSPGQQRPMSSATCRKSALMLGSRDQVERTAQRKSAEQVDIDLGARQIGDACDIDDADAAASRFEDKLSRRCARRCRRIEGCRRDWQADYLRCRSCRRDR